MSDTLPDVERFVQSMLTFAVPVVTALILVLVVYMYSLGAAPAPPPLLLVDEPTSTKKERALAKKRLKQQQQQQKKQKPSNGHVSMKTVEKAKTDAPETVKPVTVGKKSAKTANHENKVKVELKVTVAKDAKKEEELAAARLEKALMKKKPNKVLGDWVTVLSNKDKKAKQAQSVSNMAEQLAEESRQAIIEEARRLTEKAEAAKLLSSQQVKEKKETVKSNSKDSNNKAPKPSKEAKSKTVQTSSTEAKPVSDAASNVPVTAGEAAKVSSRETSSSNDSKVKVTEPGSKSEEQLSLEKNLEDAMQPAFNEFGDWEEAKPMKMKNVKKRARREK